MAYDTGVNMNNINNKVNYSDSDDISLNNLLGNNRI